MKKKIFAAFLFCVFLAPGDVWGQSNTAPLVTAPIRDPMYSRPLRFDVLGDGVDMKPLKLDYDLTSRKSLRIAQVEFNDQTYFWRLATENSQPVLYGYWPEVLIRAGTLEAIGKTGRVLWKREIPKKMVDEWRQARNLSQIPEIKKSQIILRKINEVRNGLTSVREPFKFCFSQEAFEGSQNRMCTRLLEFRDSAKGLVLTAFPQLPTIPRVIAFNEQMPLAAVREVRSDRMMQFFAELTSGATYEFVAKPKVFNLVEFVAKENPKFVRLVAWGPKPNIPVRDINFRRDTYFEKLIGWQETIGDFREFWEAIMPVDQTSLTISGEGGGAFVQDFNITKLPTEAIRPFVHFQTVPGTYVDGVKVFGYRPPNTTLSSKMNSVTVDEDSLDEFVWRFQALNKGEMNKSYLLVEHNGQVFKTYAEIYKGYAAELSARLTMLLGSGGSLLLMGETAFNYWFEDIFGWSNYTFSRQRWGLSTKYFRSITNLKLGSVDGVLQYITADLKYRFEPGLWGRDETWGLILGIHDVSYDFFKTQNLGVGVYWARSMPRIFDDIMNQFPFMNYPKWVDMEYVYYPVSLTKGITPFNFGDGAGNWSLNFHGKVLWTKQFFGEAGFGLKQLDFQTINNVPTGTARQRLTFISLYTTVGMGWSF